MIRFLLSCSCTRMTCDAYDKWDQRASFPGVSAFHPYLLSSLDNKVASWIQRTFTEPCHFVHTLAR